MPTYAYRCPSCGHNYEKLQKMSDQTRAKCPECRTRGERLISGGAGLVFKGSGFYITDYKRKGKDDEKPKEKTSEKKPDKGSAPSDKPSKSAGADN